METMNGSKSSDQLPRCIVLKNELGEETLHYNTVSRDCPEEVKQYAEKELNETEENKRKGLEKLRAFIKKEKLFELDEIYLIAVLRCCKYDIKKSESKLKKFLNRRHIIVKNLKRLNDEKIEKLISDGISDCLPWSDKEGRPIYVFRPNLDLDAYDYKDIAAYAECCLFSVFKYPLPTIKGTAAIVDCSIKSPAMLLQMANEYRKYIGLEKTVPIRIGRIDFVNSNTLAQSIFAVVRPLLPNKIVKRIAFHGSDLTELHKLYHPAILPEDFGGTLGAVDTHLFKEERIRVIRSLRAENI